MTIDHLLLLEEAQKEIRTARALVVSSEASAHLEDADVLLEQALHALRGDEPCDVCGYGMEEA